MGLLLAKINKHLTIVPIATMIETTTQSETIRTIFLFFYEYPFSEFEIKLSYKTEKDYSSNRNLFFIANFSKI